MKEEAGAVRGSIIDKSSTLNMIPTNCSGTDRKIGVEVVKDGT